MQLFLFKVKLKYKKMIFFKNWFCVKNREKSLIIKIIEVNIFKGFTYCTNIFYILLLFDFVSDFQN